MATDVTVKIAGEAGQGIQTIGSLLSNVCHRSGLFIFAVNDFESRIRGGYSFTSIRISDRPLLAPSLVPDILVAIDAKTADLDMDNLAGKGIALVNTEEKETGDSNRYPISLDNIAREAGGQIASNTVAAGLLLSILGSPLDRLEKEITEQFSKKGEKVLALNMAAAKAGYEKGEKISFHTPLPFQDAADDRVIMTGADAAALGALASNCRFFSFYPMSPATGIFASAAPYTDHLPIVVEQAEDEIAAVTMAIGSSFAGVKSLTATSGGGFSLMTEGLGLAAMTETPLVVINAQRPGPATGLPTRTAQSDLLFTLNASQDEFPRFVFAPGTLHETFDSVRRAFDLSDRYQVPAIVLMDQFLCDSMRTEEGKFDFQGKASDALSLSEASAGDKEKGYLRYRFTSGGISRRLAPGTSSHLVRSTANEHDQEGNISEDPENRTKMMDKRLGKLSAMKEEMESPLVFSQESGTLLCGWGSTQGSIIEAGQVLRGMGHDVGWLIFKDLWPLDWEKVTAIAGDKKLIMVEQNATGQLGSLITGQTGIFPAGRVLKYDGRPMGPRFIVQTITTMMEQ